MAPLKLSEESEALYSRMLGATKKSEGAVPKTFFQADLQPLADDSAKTVQQLLTIIQELSGHALLRTSKAEGALCWTARTREAAKKILTLNDKERLLYEHVENAHLNGIWSKLLKKRSGISDRSFDKAMQALESKRLVKAVADVTKPFQKTYMLWHLSPSNEVTGGAFYDAGDLDESLVQELSNLIVYHVRSMSWKEVRVRRPKRDRSPPHVDDSVHGSGDQLVHEQRNHRKRKYTLDIEDSVSQPKPKRRRHSHHQEEEPTEQIAYFARSRKYPTAESIHDFITVTQAIRAAKLQQLTEADIQAVIDVLVWEGKLEKVGSGYRTVRGVEFRPGKPGDDGKGEGADTTGPSLGNGLTGAPCGRCPVFDLCEEGGPINAKSCVYFDEWLNSNS